MFCRRLNPSGVPGISGALVLCLIALGGCGLIDADVTNFDLTLPSKTYSLDTTQYAGASQIPKLSCAMNENACATAAKAACEPGACEGVCEPAKTCKLIIHVAKWKTIDLLAEKPELADIKDNVDVTIDAVKYRVHDNSLNVETPEFAIYVAPMTVMTPTVDAKRIGTIPPVPAGTDVGPADVQTGKDGLSLLAARMGDFRTPFNIIVAADLVVGAGTPIPTGKLTADINVKAHAGI
jgi:hypothetical protein